MNSLSWFLYLVDLITGVESLMETLAIIGACFAVVTLFSWIMFTAESKESHRSEDFKKQSSENASKSAKTLKGVAGVTVFFALIVTVIPSEKTMYLILGSEATEAASMSETGKRVQNAINKKLDEYLGEQ